MGCIAGNVLKRKCYLGSGDWQYFNLLVTVLDPINLDLKSTKVPLSSKSNKDYWINFIW